MSTPLHPTLSPAAYYRMNEQAPAHFAGELETVFPLLPAVGAWLDPQKNTRICYKSAVDVEPSPMRGWQVSTWWFDSKPFGIECTAGRPDHQAFYCTDRERYLEAERYLLELIRQEDEEDTLIEHPEHQPLEAISSFYGHHAGDFLYLDADGNKCPAPGLLQPGDIAEFAFDAGICGGATQPVRVRIKDIIDPTYRWETYRAELVTWLGSETGAQWKRYHERLEEGHTVCIRVGHAQLL